MGSCAKVMALLAFGIFLGVMVGPADGMPCFYADRDWIDKGLDFIYDNGGTLAEVKSIGGIAMRCYSREEKIGFVVAVVILAILVLSLLSCIASCCSSSQGSSRIVVVRGMDPKMNV